MVGLDQSGIASANFVACGISHYDLNHELRMLRGFLYQNVRHSSGSGLSRLLIIR